ncbi:hypothetical protein BX286_0461 [Streptomyces sp. 3211.6]|uniref:hypothetical protein n=1 Tax=Streptomyces sp. 3211.6 TaxID=1938845 RepID=UPI000F240B6D|nr:hypothetical protein [Streptomyces sp. 3211.6]RKT02553.1 hypothetical protein BX286_0461 [Streptomyces sp. 3211.6]
MSQHAGWGQHHPGQPVPPWGGWAPRPPQPGVIPLAPLGTGDVIGGAFRAFRSYWKPLVGIIMLVQGIGFLLVAVAIGITVAGIRPRFAAVFDVPSGERPAGEDVAALLLYLAPVVVLLVLTMVLLGGLITSLAPAVIQEAVLGRPATFGAMWRRCWSRLPSVLGTLLCTGLLAGGPMLVLYALFFSWLVTSGDRWVTALPVFMMIVFLVGMPVMLWLTVRFSLAPAVAVCEGLGPVEAMRRSSRLVSGGWWRTFGIAALGNLLGAAVGYAVQLPFAFLGMFALFPTVLATGDAADPSTLLFGMVVYVACILLGTAVGAVFQLGYPQLVLSLLYVDQRIRKENLAEALLASAAATPPAGAYPAGPR